MTSHEDAIADAYNRGLAFEKSGDLDKAEAAYAEVLRLDPSDKGGASVRLAAIGRGVAPTRAPEAYVEMLFDQHADAFESILVDQLDYDVPALITARLDALSLGPFARVLDLGCGTGLVAEALGDRTKEIIGLDLSEAMLDICEAKSIYDGLYSADLIAFLQDNEEVGFDAIIAADVLPYLGALEAFFAGVTANLSVGGVFAFSSELTTNASTGYCVGVNQRFQHGEEYVISALAQVGFEILAMDAINVRNQDDAPTQGHLVVARMMSGI